MIIYLSGPISGTTDYFQRFLDAENEVKANGDKPINPVRIMKGLEHLEYEDMLKIDKKFIELCDGIYMLLGWRDSHGASIERNYAIAAGKMIQYQHEPKGGGNE